MIPSLDFSSLKDARWHQFAVRFILGGAVTLCTGLIAQHWGRWSVVSSFRCREPRALLAEPTAHC
jgi:hypothetical protein